MPPARNSHSLGRLWLPLLLSLCPALSIGLAPCRAAADDKPDAAPQPDPEYIRKMIPEKIAGEYRHGRLIPLEVENRQAYVIEPTGTVDPARRWIWIFPFWLGINDGHGVLHHRWYVDQYLEKGFHVAGINVGTSCGSPRAAAVCQQFYEVVRERFKLHSRARLLVQSNGGLIGYAWAFRHPECVERIGGICPATDFRTWPGLDNVINFPEKGLDYGLTREELADDVARYNPVDNLIPLARNHVKILHTHGDADDLVPMEENSTELERRYTALGGPARIVVIEGLGHGGQQLYESQPLLDFLLEDCESLGLKQVASPNAYLLRWERWGYEDVVKGDQETKDELLETVELLIEPARPFFTRLKALGRTRELRGELTKLEDSPKLQLNIEMSTVERLQEIRSDEEHLNFHENRNAVTTTLRLAPGEPVTLGGAMTTTEISDGQQVTSKSEFKVVLIRPCVANAPEVR